MKKALTVLSLYIIIVAAASPCCGEEATTSGSLFLGGRALNIDRQSANFNQYNAIGPGLFTGGDVNYDADRDHFTADGAYLGLDDMYIKLKGGRYGVYKYSLYFNEFPHNLSFKDRTIYNAPGSQDLSFNGPASAIPADSSRWPGTSFDYKVRRKDVGGTFDVTAVRPFFINFDVNQLNREGQKPHGAPDALGQTFGRMVEFPLPVDNATANLNGLVGWKSKQFYAAFSGGFSKFSNRAEFTRFRDPYTAGAAAATGTVVEEPDNKSWSLKFTGSTRLPYASTFVVNAGYTHNTSETTLLNTIEDGTTAAPIVKTLGLSDRVFNGDVEYWNIGAVLASNPVGDLNTKVYYKYLDRKNNSDLITFVDPSTGNSTSSEIFDHQKTTFGAEGSYRFARYLKGILGYEFSDLRRRAKETEAEAAEDPEVPELRITDTWDHRISAQLVYNPLDWLGGRLKYQKLYRGATFRFAPANPTVDFNAALDNYLRRFHAANKRQDMVKLTADVSPLAGLDIALEYAYKHDNYYKTILGVNKSTGNEFLIDATYDWRSIKLFGFFDYDTSYWKQTQRNVTPLPGASADPGSVANANSFNWDARLDNINYAYGFGATLPLIKNKLAFTVQYDFQKNNGTADFTSQFLGSGLGQNNMDIAAWDDYTTQTISARLNYEMTKDLGLMFGYLYSQFRWSDGQFNGYRYVVGSPINTFLTGAYTDQPYNANVFYARMAYRF